MNPLENWYAGTYIIYHGSDRMYIVFVQKKSEESTRELLRIPGGKRERALDNTPEETALREIYEETGLNFFKQKDLLEKTSESLKQDYARYLYKIHITGEPPEDLITKAPWEIHKVMTLDEDEILYQGAPILEPYHKGASAIIKNYKTSKYIPKQ